MADQAPNVTVALEDERKNDSAGETNGEETAPDMHGKDGQHEAKDFVPATGFTTAEAEELLKKWGRNELEEKSTPKWLIYLMQLYQPMPIMIWIAAAVEAGIQNWPDFGILLGIQFINATLGWYETTKAGDAVAALKASLKPSATCKRDGKWQTLDAALLVPGDLVLLASGSAVPADCLINHGQVDVDQSALTGESLPVTMYRGDSAKMGSTITRGEVEGTVEATGSHTFFGKTASMLQQGSEMGHLQKMLLKIMFVLVAASLILCGTAFGYLMGMGETFKESISFTVVLLVASIPIAIEIVCTTTLALGSRQLSSHGAIVSRLAAIEDLAGMNMLCSDKTGTLTLNKMVIQDETPTFVPGVDQAKLLRYAAMAAKWREPPRDALDTLVLTTADLSSLDNVEQLDYMPFDPTIKRTEGTVREGGTVYKITKGAPNILLQLAPDGVVRKATETLVASLGRRGIRCLAVAKSDEVTPGAFGPWHILGLLTFLDPPRPDTKVTIHKAMEFGVDVKMITGDHLLIAKETARVLGLGTNIKDAKGLPSMGPDGKPPPNLAKDYGELIMNADGFAQVFPEHKYLIVETLRQCGFASGMTGDGVNDAPALKRADVGVAVQGATDAARAAADIILTQPGLSTIVDGIVIARCIFQRMKTFINYRIAATLQLLCFFFIAVLTMHPTSYVPANTPEAGIWPAFFKMPVIMLMLITLLNDGTLISIGYDNVNPSHMPEKWNLPALFFTSIVLGSVACGSSLLLLWAALDSWNPSSLFAKWNMPGMPYGKITTMVYLKVSVSDFLTLFSARTHEGFFWTSRPSWLLLGGAMTALSLSTILASVWPMGELDGIETEGLAYGGYTLMPLWIWIYCIVWWFIQDALKVISYYLMHRFNWFNVNTDKLVNMREAVHANELPLARASVGLVESKLLQAKVEDAIKKVEDVARTSASASRLNRVSAAAALVRQSVSQQRRSLSKPSSGALEEGDPSDAIQQQVAALEQIARREVGTGEGSAEIQQHIESLRDTAGRLKLARHSAARK